MQATKKSPAVRRTALTIYIKSKVNCVNCQKIYVPNEVDWKEGNPALAVNNFCTVRCYERYMKR